MISKVFTIYDSKAESFLPPFMFKTVGEAERAVSVCMEDPQHNFAKFSEDYTLFELGSWDDSVGRYILHETPRSVSLLMHYKRVVS